MTETVDQMAREAGFLKVGEFTTSNKETNHDRALGFDLVKTPYMPEGFIGLRSKHSILMISPGGKTRSIPIGLHLLKDTPV